MKTPLLLIILLLQCSLPLVAGYTVPPVSLQLKTTAFVPSQLTSQTTARRSHHRQITSLFASQEHPNENDGTSKSLSNKSSSLSSYDPFNVAEDGDWSSNDAKEETNMKLSTAATALPVAVTLAATAATASFFSTSIIDNAYAAGAPFSSGDFNPDNFRPVCPTSDSIYRVAQGTTQSLVGQENFVEYGPLIAGGLLRIRLELCVVESFFNEAVGPFIQREGLGWILPLHETVETFLAGTIFALASTFILVGSTKIVSVMITYADVFIGAPLRLFGGFAFDRAKGKPVTLDLGIGPFKKRVIGPGSPKDDDKKEETLEEIFDFSNVEGKDLPIALFSGAVKGIGETSKVAREVLEALDLFVGRYLTLIATGYVGLKFIHFKIFPDFPPF